MLANISTPPTPSVTAWLRCTIVRGPAAGEPLDEGRRPQRPGDVHRRLQGDLGQVHHLAQRAGLGNAHPAHVEVEVEVRVDHPSRRRRRQRRHDDLLPQPQHLAATRSRTWSGSVPSRAWCRESPAPMIPERVRGLASPRCSIWSTR